MDTDTFAAKERTERNELKNVGQRVPPVSLQSEIANHTNHAKAFGSRNHADKL